MPPRKRLGQLLTELGVVDEHQLQSALGHQKQWGGKLGAILVQKGFCKEEEVVSALSRHLGMPRVRLSEQKVDPRAIKFVAKPIAEKLHVFAYEVSGSGRSEVVTIAMSDPTDLSAVDQLAFHTGKRIRPMLAGDSEIVSAIAEHYGAEDKPRPSPAVAPPVVTPTAPAGPSGPFGRRVEPPVTRTPPGVPRMTPVMTPVWSPATAAPMAPPPAKPAPVDLPAAGDDEKLALEPIAAHSQTEAVEGQTDFSGTGSAADTVEGLEPAGHAQAAAQENWSGGGWDGGQSWGAPPEGAAPSQDWAAPPAEPLPDWGDQAAEAAWGAPQQEPAHGEPAAHEGHPAEAEDAAHHAQREGAVFDAPAEEAAPDGQPEPDAFEALPEEAAGPHDAADEALPEEESAHEVPDEALPEETAYEAQPQETASEESELAAESASAPHAGGEELPVDAILGTAEDAHSGFSADDASHAGAEAGHAADESTEAPDAWGTTEDPLAAQEASGWSGSEAAHAAGDAFAEASHEGSAEASHEGFAEATHEGSAEPAHEGFAEAADEGFEGAAGAADSADEQGFDIEESEPAAAEDVAADWGTSSPAEEAAAETGAAGDATVEMAPVAEEAAPAEEHAAPAYAPADGAYADDDPEARPAEAPTTPVFGMVSPDEVPAGTDEAEPPAEFEAHAAAAEGAEELRDAGEVHVEWSEPPHPGEAATHDAAAHEAAPYSEDLPADVGAEGWVPPPEAQEGAGSLSSQDLTTLASAGIDPHDPAAALRLLASLVRALERKGLLDLADVAAEVHESTAQEAHVGEDLPPA